MSDIHDILVLLLMFGGAVVELQLTRFLVAHRRLRERELELLSQPPAQDPMPSEMMEAMYGFPNTTAGTGSPFNGDNLWGR